jgi:GT2 family glycosyltransferase
MEDEKSPRVLVGCVTHDKAEAYLTDFLAAIRAQDYKDIDVLFVDTSANDEYAARLRGTSCIVMTGDASLDHSIKRVTSGRNLIRDFAIEKGYDFVWFVDADVLPQPDALSRLLSAGKAVNAGVCLMSLNAEGNAKVLPNIFKFNDAEKVLEPLSLGEMQGSSLIEVSAAGFGCMLLSSKVISSVKFRYFEDSMAGEDIAFCTDAKELGFPAFADTSVRCTHLVFPPGDPRNKRFMFDSYEKVN